MALQTQTEVGTHVMRNSPADLDIPSATAFPEGAVDTEQADSQTWTGSSDGIKFAAEIPGGEETPHQDLNLPERPNLYEAKVYPGQDSILDDPLLRRTPLIINKTHNMLICIDCKFAIRPEAALIHMRAFHASCRVPPRFAAQLRIKYPSLVNKAPQFEEPVDPIFGLAIPPTLYTLCNRCLSGFPDLTTWRGHYCTKAGVELKNQMESSLSLVQTFFCDHERSYFPVHTPAVSSAQAPDDFTLYKQQSKERDRSQRQPYERPDHPGLERFLAEEGWTAHVKGICTDKITRLTSLPGQDEGFSLLGTETFILMSNIQRVIQNSGSYARKLISRRPS